MLARPFPWRVLVLVALSLAAVEAQEWDEPGPIFADVRAQLGVGVGWGAILSAAIEPEFLYLSEGKGYGVELAVSDIGSSDWGSRFVGVGPKFALIHRLGSGPLCWRFGTGLLALCSFPMMGFGPELGGRLFVESGVVPLLAGRAAFPIEAFLSAQVGAGAGASTTLGLSAGFGWIFGNQGSD